MQTSLNQQQRLALQDKKLLEEYTAENQDLKVLRMFSSEFGNELIDNRVQEEKTEPGMPQTKKGGMSGNV